MLQHSSQGHRQVFYSSGAQHDAGGYRELVQCTVCCDSHSAGKVKAFLQTEFAKLNTSNTLRVSNEHGSRAFYSDVNHPNYLAGRNAIKAVFGVEPDLTREGGSIPVALTFEEVGQ